MKQPPPLSLSLSLPVSFMFFVLSLSLSALRQFLSPLFLSLNLLAVAGVGTGIRTVWVAPL